MAHTCPARLSHSLPQEQTRAWPGRTAQELLYVRTCPAQAGTGRTVPERYARALGRPYRSERNARA